VYFLTYKVWLMTVLWLLSVPVSAQCLDLDKKKATAITSWHVFDGDTLDVGADERLRLAFINTPELGRTGAPDQPQAQAAKQAVISFMQTSQQTFWQVDKRASSKQQRDRYGRHLGMVYNNQGAWLAEHLVREGLAFVVSIPPHVAPDCLWQQEQKARKNGKGFWSSDLAQPVLAKQVSIADGGFLLVTGTVTQVTSSKHDWYVELDGDIALRINKQQWLNYAGYKPNTWLGKQVLARGWLAWRSLSRSQRKRGYKHGIMNLSHPHMLQIEQ